MIGLFPVFVGSLLIGFSATSLACGMSPMWLFPLSIGVVNIVYGTVQISRSVR